MFGFGGSKATSSSASLNVSENGAESFGVSDSIGEGLSGSEQQSSQRVAFEGLFQKLYGGAGAAAAGIDTGGISAAGNQLFSGGLDFLKQLGGGAGMDALEGRLTDTTARDSNLDLLQSRMGELFNEELLPGITSGGVATGTLGGSRDAVEKGLASRAVGREFSSGAASIINADQGQRDSVAAQLAQLMQSGAGTGLSALDSLYGLKSGAESAGLQPFEMLSQIMGGPTVLGQSTGSSFAQDLSRSFSQQGSKSYGYDYGTSQSKSRAVSLNVGAGGGGAAPAR